MRYIPLAEIHIAPDRQRQFFDPDRLADLQDSISRLGLIQPLVVAADGTLIAGERRLKCLQNLQVLGDVIYHNGALVPDGFAPAVLPNELSPTALFEIELEENIKRHDLSWQEHAAAIAKLARLRELQAAQQGIPAPTAADLADELEGRRDGAYQDKVRKTLIVSKHLDNAEVAKAKSVDDAFKILKRQEQAASNIAKAAEVGLVTSAQRIETYNRDCLEWGWEYIEAGRPLFDIICSDPPYGMDAQAFGDGGGSYVGITHQYKDDRNAWLALMNGFAQLAFAITKPDAHMYLACDIDGFLDLKLLLQQAGWRVHRTPLINHKRDANRVPWPSQGPRRCYELVLYAVKGAKPTTAIYSDVFETTGDENLGHGAQKPIVFWDDLLRRSAIPGDRVLDPFAGTGGIIIAANKANLYCTVVEREAQYYGIILNRLEGLK